MKKPNISISLVDVSYPGGTTSKITPDTVFELNAQISGLVSIQPLKQNPFQCETVSITVIGRVFGSKVQDGEFYQLQVELSKQYTWEPNTQNLPFSVGLELPASSYTNKKGNIEYSIVARTFIKNQVFVEAKQVIMFKRQNQLIKSMQAPLVYLVNRQGHQLYLQSDQVYYQGNEVVQGTIYLQSTIGDLQDLEMKLIKSEQHGTSKEIQPLANILLCENLKSGQEIPFCLPLGAFQLQPSLSFSQIFIQTKIMLSYVIDQKREEGLVEVVIRE